MCRFSSFFWLLSFLLFNCTPQTSPSPPLQTTFYVYRFSPPALVEFSEDFRAIGEIPSHLPPNCGLFNIYPAPVGKFMAIELNCPNGQTVLFVDASTSLSAGSAVVTQPVVDSDSHFLAWDPDGKSVYLKVDALGNTHIARVDTNGRPKSIPITEFTYDLSVNPSNHDFTFTFSRGLGQGSELWLAKDDGQIVKQSYADQFNYISFARFSPDGMQIAFIKVPDSQTPFTVGELWVMEADGMNPRKLADADAGHGYSASWSPDGKRIAFVVRENRYDEGANQSSDLLISNLHIVEVESGVITQITDFVNGRVETPFWSPDGNSLAFNVVVNDRMEVRIADLTTGEIRPLLPESTCCPAWMRE
jgi:Tol biopolymer transport system component